MQDDDLTGKELSEFYKNAVSSLNITENSFISTRTSDDVIDPIDKAIYKYKFHPIFFWYKNTKKITMFFHSKQLRCVN